MRCFFSRWERLAATQPGASSPSRKPSPAAENPTATAPAAAATPFLRQLLAEQAAAQQRLEELTRPLTGEEAARVTHGEKRAGHPEQLLEQLRLTDPGPPGWLTADPSPAYPGGNVPGQPGTRHDEETAPDGLTAAALWKEITATVPPRAAYLAWNEGWTATEIAAHLGVARRTVSRDLDTVRAASLEGGQALCGTAIGSTAAPCASPRSSSCWPPWRTSRG